ncbi:hypothetical protein PFISCL1PPCAC_13716, partial [Pristionchus fissidentatus]
STTAVTSTSTATPTTTKSTTTVTLTTTTPTTTVTPTSTKSTTTVTPTTTTPTTTVTPTTTKSTTTVTPTTTTPTTTVTPTTTKSTTTVTPTTTTPTTTVTPTTTKSTTTVTPTTITTTTTVTPTTTKSTTTVTPTTTTLTTTVTPTTTKSTTTVTPTTTTPTTITTCENINNNEICDEYESWRCERAVLSGTAYTIVKIVMYIATIWVVLWCIATIIVNILHKNTGHHRWIHLLEEIGIIVLWISIGILNLTLRNNSFCKVNSAIIHYFVVMVAACFVFESIFANAMVHNKKKLNGSNPPLVNYVVPVLIALIPCLVTYFTNKEHHGVNGMHCFVITELSIMYAFVLPAAALLMIASFVSSLGNLACDLTSSDQDSNQCYWAKKSCKILSFLSFWMFFAYLTCMFGSSSQRLWVLILFVLQSLFLGPLIFVAHTFCHVNTSSKWYRPSLPGRFYTPCHSSRALPIIPPL